MRAVRLQGSITSAEDCARVAGEVSDAFGGRLDILVNSAFHGGEHVRFEDADLQRWRRPVDVNYLGTLQLTQAMLPLLRRAGEESGDARIVMVNTMSVQHLEAKAGSYAASKAALGAVTKTLALELGEYGIRVNAVHPGYIFGDSVKIYLEWQAEERGEGVTWEDVYDGARRGDLPGVSAALLGDRRRSGVLRLAAGQVRDGNRVAGERRALVAAVGLTEGPSASRTKAPPPGAAQRVGSISSALASDLRPGAARTHHHADAEPEQGGHAEHQPHGKGGVGDDQ